MLLYSYYLSGSILHKHMLRMTEKWSVTCCGEGTKYSGCCGYQYALDMF